MDSAFVSGGAVGKREYFSRQHVRDSSRSRRAIRMSAVSITREDGRKRIVVTGLGVLSSLGNDPDNFYDRLLDGESGVTTVEGFDVEGWPTAFASQIKAGAINTEGYVTAKMINRLDPFLTYTLVVGKKTLEHAGIGIGSEAFEALDRSRCGILIGSGMGGISIYQEGINKMLAKKRLSPFTIPYTITNMGSALLGIDTGFTGPNYSLSTACATGNYCINNAAAHIMRGEADLIVAGGVEAAITPVHKCFPPSTPVVLPPFFCIAVPCLTCTNKH